MHTRLHNALIPQLCKEQGIDSKGIGSHVAHLWHDIVDPRIPRLVPSRVPVSERGILGNTNWLFWLVSFSNYI